MKRRRALKRSLPPVAGSVVPVTRRIEPVLLGDEKHVFEQRVLVVVSRGVACGQDGAVRMTGAVASRCFASVGTGEATNHELLVDGLGTLVRTPLVADRGVLADRQWSLGGRDLVAIVDSVKVVNKPRLALLGRAITELGGLITILGVRVTAIRGEFAAVRGRIGRGSPGARRAPNDLPPGRRLCPIRNLHMLDRGYGGWRGIVQEP